MSIRYKFLFFLLPLLFPLLLFSQNERTRSNLQLDYVVSIPEDVDSASVALALKQLEKGEYKKAIRLSRKMQRKNPLQSNWYFIQIIAYEKLGKTDKTESIFEAAFENTAPSALLYYNYAVKKIKDGDFSDAEEFIQQSLQLNEKFPLAHLALSRIHEQEGNRIKAILPLYAYFFFLPEQSKNDSTLSKLKQLLYRGIQVVQENGLTFSMPFSKENGKDDLLRLEIMLNGINTYFAKDSLPQKNRLLASTDLLFDQLNKSNVGREDIWWSFYAKIFGSIAEKSLTEVFVFYELEYNSPLSNKYLSHHQEELMRYRKWKRKL